MVDFSRISKFGWLGEGKMIIWSRMRPFRKKNLQYEESRSGKLLCFAKCLSILQTN